MKPNYDTKLKNEVTGEELADTLGYVCATALLTAKSCSDPARAYDLALSIRDGDADLNPSDVEFLLSIVKTAYVPMIYGQVRDAFKNG